MARVFTTVMGSRIRIGNYGEAVLETILEPGPKGKDPQPKVIEQGVAVPEDVAADFEWEMAGCPADGDGNRDMAGKPSRAPHALYRIERDPVPKAPPPKPAEKAPDQPAKSGKE